MKRIAFHVAASATLLGAAGCVQLPVYQPPADARTTLVNVAAPARGIRSACIAGKRYQLVPDAQGNVSLPVDERVTVGSSYFWASGNVNWSCFPATSFVPKAGQAYTMVFEVEPENHACSYRPYRQTTANRIGLDFEPTLGYAQPCAKP